MTSTPCGSSNCFSLRAMLILLFAGVMVTLPLIVGCAWYSSHQETLDVQRDRLVSDSWIEDDEWDLFTDMDEVDDKEIESKADLHSHHGADLDHEDLEDDIQGFNSDFEDILDKVHFMMDSVDNDNVFLMENQASKDFDIDNTDRDIYNKNLDEDSEDSSMTVWWYDDIATEKKDEEWGEGAEEDDIDYADYFFGDSFGEDTNDNDFSFVKDFTAGDVNEEDIEFRTKANTQLQNDEVFALNDKNYIDSEMVGTVIEDFDSSYDDFFGEELLNEEFNVGNIKKQDIEITTAVEVEHVDDGIFTNGNKIFRASEGKPSENEEGLEKTKEEQMYEILKKLERKTHKPKREKAKIFYSSGDTYHGDLFDEVPDGFGIMEYKDGSTYQGLWKNGYKDGQGTLIDRSGDVVSEYTGMFRRGMKTYYGKISFANGVQYQGGWNADMYYGYGECDWNSWTYHGTFLYGLMDGTGTVIYPDGTRLVGNWESGHPTGFGQYVQGDGDCSEVKWTDEGPKILGPCPTDPSQHHGD